MKKYEGINKISKMVIAGILAVAFMILCGFSPVQAGEYEQTGNAVLSRLPDHPDRSISVSEIKKYYAVSKKETSIYNLQPGTVYVMYETPSLIPCSGGYKLIRVEKRWEQERGGIFAWFDATMTTIQYYDYAENTYEMNAPIGGGFYRFYSLDKISNIYEPSLENQMDII